MRQLLSILTPLIFPVFLCGQQPGFKKLYSGDITGASFVDILWDGEKITTTGQFLTDTSSVGFNGLLYMELDTNGNTLSTNIYFEPNDAVTSSTGNGIVELSDGRKCVMSQILYDTSVLFNIYENGLLSLVNKYPIASLNAWLYNLTELDNSILLAGKISNYQYLSEGLLIKTNKHGNKIWEKHYGIQTLDIGIGKPFIVDNNTIVIPAGKTFWKSNGPIESNWTKSWFFAIDSMGNKKWEWESDNNVETGAGHRIYRMADGNWLYASSEFVPMPGQIDDWGTRPKLVCRDSVFNLVWERYLTSTAERGNYIRALTPTPDGSFVVVGRWNTSSWLGNTVIHKFSSSGDIIWTRYDDCSPTLGCEIYLGGTAILPSGSIIAAGYTEDLELNKSYGILIKVNKDGCMDTINCHLTETKEIIKIHNIKIFPNPSDDIIQIENPIGDHIQLANLQGQIIRNELIAGDSHSMNISYLTSGVYLLQMSEGTLHLTFKIIKK